MALVSLKEVYKSYGAEKILSGASFVLNDGDRAGLIGVNGSGKSTILRIISGRTAPDSGQMACARGMSIGYLEQEAGSGGAGTILEEMLSARPSVLALKKKLETQAHAVGILAGTGGAGYETALTEYGVLLEEFEKTGGYAYDNMVTGALRGLGFQPDEFDRPLSTLSGGQKTRLAMAKLLLAGHDLLMLDEPTNHLDIPAIAWLEEFLKEYKGTVLLVSHDRYFLDNVANRILELSDGEVEEYPGNFSRYRVEKEKRTEARLREYELASARLAKEKEYINRMRAGVNARQAKGREKRLARFEMPDRPASEKKGPALEWTEVARSSDSVVVAEGLSKRFGGREVIADATFMLRRGERVGVVGRNGCGKSTLLKMITGEIRPDTGGVSLGPKVKTAYYAQGLEGLDPYSTVLDELWSVEPLATEQKMRDMLGAFLFSGDDALKKVGVLSGGEKGRLAIAKVVLAGANLLILDEPTNHLDIPSREALEDALAGFTGTVLAVSHDRYFLDGFADRIYEIKDGRLRAYHGNYSYYQEKKGSEEQEAARALTEGREAWESRKQEQAKKRRNERDEEKKASRIRDIEFEIEEVEAGLREAESKLADPGVYGDFGKVTELTQCYNILKEKRDQLYDLLEEEVR